MPRPRRRLLASSRRSAGPKVSATRELRCRAQHLESSGDSDFESAVEFNFPACPGGAQLGIALATAIEAAFKGNSNRD